MNIIMERYPYRYIEDGVIELNGKPDYRIQKFNAVSYTHLTLQTKRIV